MFTVYSVKALDSYDYYVVRLLIMFPLLICIYDSHTKYTTVKPCNLLLLPDQPDGNNQLPEAQKPTRLPGRTSPTYQESSKSHKCSASGVKQPCKASSQILLRSDISKDKEQRCRAQPGNPARWLQAGAKSLYKFAHWAKKTHSLYLLETKHIPLIAKGKLPPSQIKKYRESQRRRPWFLRGRPSTGFDGLSICACASTLLVLLPWFA